MTPVIRFAVNDVQREVVEGTGGSLLRYLHDDLGLTGAKDGCGEGACGACTVMVDGEPARSCTLPVEEVGGRSVVTVEGLSREGALHPVARAFLEMDAMQCGYCTPGMIVGTAALLARVPDPTDAQIREALAGNICRCCVYPRILRAVRRAATAPETPAEPPTAAEPRPRSAGGIAASPWDLTPLEGRDWFEALGEGLVVVLPPGSAAARRAPGPWAMNGGAWIHVGAEGGVTAFTGKVDVGQDNRTTLSLIVAEELRVPLESVRLAMGDTDVSPFDVGTWGSRSTPDAGEDLRVTAASTREHLLLIAADRWDRNPGELEVSDGAVRTGDGARSATFAELVTGARRVEEVSPGVALTPRDAWHTAGRAAHGVGRADVVTGGRRYTSDLTRPGMLHGAVLRGPSAGAILRSVELRDARAVEDAVVVHEGSFVGVAAERRDAARQVLRRVHAEWDAEPLPDEPDLTAYLRAHPVDEHDWERPIHEETGDVDAALARAAVRLEATYTTAYIAHAPLETRAALAEWGGGRLTVWVGTQQPFGVRSHLAAELGLDEARVRVVVPPTGGGFGGKHSADVAVEAARLARAAGRPVHVRWSREEEFRFGYVRPAAVIDVRSGAAAGGALAAWEVHTVNAGAQAIVPPYTIPDRRVTFQPAASPLPQGAYRALAATANTFARESHIDEMAGRVGADPLEYRLRHIGDERLAAVLRAAAERGGWPQRSHEAGQGMGVACGVEKGGYVATCVAVRMRDGGRPEVLRAVTAFDCGAVVNPDGLASQVEGATVMGLGAALFEAVHFDRAGLLNPSFSAYRVPRMPDVPDVEAVLVDRREIASAGGGEAPIIAVAPALANALFAATGRRLRSMPLVPDGVVH